MEEEILKSPIEISIPNKALISDYIRHSLAIGAVSRQQEDKTPT
jgi:hypothetical protein